MKRCKSCNQPSGARSRCPACLERLRAEAAELREYRRAHKLCTTCGAPVERVTDRNDPRRFYRLCAEHRRYYAARKEAAK